MKKKTLFRKILVPHDLSDTATHALRVAADLAEEHGGSITVLHVLTPYYASGGYPTQGEIIWTPPAGELLAEQRRNLDAMVRKTLGARAKGVLCRVTIGESVPTILDAAKRHGLIVMTTLGRS